jgi:TolB-like protein
MESDELCATLAASAESTVNSRLADTTFVDFVPYTERTERNAACKMSTVLESTDPDYIIDGTVRRCGRQIRLDIDFVQRMDGRLRWSHEVLVEADRSEDAIQWLAQDVCRRVARAIAADIRSAAAPLARGGAAFAQPAGMPACASA